MVTIDGLEPAEHAAPAYNMCAGPRRLEHPRRLSMAARQTSRTGTMHGLSTLQHMVRLEEARRCGVALTVDSVEICICQCYVIVAW